MLIAGKGIHFVGALSGVLANLLLGLSSVFWKYIGSLSAIALVGYRVYFSLLTVLVVLYACGRMRSLFSRLRLKLFVIHASAAILIAVNWGVFIWASIHGRVLENSIGYLLAPLLLLVALEPFLRGAFYSKA
ncbi:hypothetical protein [Pseudomonas sp. SDO55104_S430]